MSDFRIPKIPKILQEAADTIKERGRMRDTGGEKERSMKACVEAFNALEGTSLTERQGWAFMRVLKMARSAASAKNNLYDRDSYVDSVGYIVLEDEAAVDEMGE